MFDLDVQITEWRRQTLAAGIGSPVPLDELESHLRDEIEHQMRLGLSETEAFNLAVQQIGQAGMLKNEFAKIRSSETRKRKITRLFFVFAALTYLLCGTFGLLNAEMTTKTRLLGFAAIAVSVLSLLGVRHACKLFPIHPRRRSRFAIQVIITLAAILWMMSYFCLVLPHCDFTMGQLMVATLWAMTPWAIVCGVTDGMDEAVYRRSKLADL